MTLDIIKPQIFPKDKIEAGVVTKNKALNPPFGLSFSAADFIPESEVEKAHKLLAEYLQVKVSAMKFQHQIHGDDIQIIDFSTGYNESDGMITNLAGLALNVKLADCAGVLIYDTQNSAIGVFHSGWRGTKLNTAGKGIRKMSENYGSEPEKLLVYITPCASAEKYEAGREFKEYFPNSVLTAENGKYYFDNRKEIKNQLTNSGISESNIEISRHCTISNENLHSYRREGEKAGRMTAFIMMKRP